MKAFYVCLLACLTVVAPLLAQQRGADPLSGTWAGDWGPTPADRNPVIVELKWDGKALTGVVNPGPTAVMLQKATFNPTSGSVHLEADVDNHGRKLHYVIDGKLDRGTMTGTWAHDNRKGDFKITRK